MPIATISDPGVDNGAADWSVPGWFWVSRGSTPGRSTTSGTPPSGDTCSFPSWPWCWWMR